MQGRSGTGRNGTSYFYYACTNRDCRLRAVSHEVEDAVIERIGALASAPETVEALTSNRVLKKRRLGAWEGGVRAQWGRWTAIEVSAQALVGRVWRLP